MTSSSQIPAKPKLFRLSFRKVVSLTAMIMLSSFVLFNSAVQIYEIHIFIISSSSFPGIIPTINDQLSAVLLPKLVRALHRCKYVIRNLKQKQIKSNTQQCSQLQTKFVRSTTDPASSPVKFHFSQRNVELPTPGKLLNCEDNLFVVFQKISIPPTEGTFLLDPQPPGFSIPGDACIPPTPWNFRNFPTWLGSPWKEYFRQKRRCTIISCER